ncbi:hypothetical protein HDV57DRAFT_380273 [Trichoderma longibrachiatum]|uniref:CCHC-type domain-containing protein n=1 Tax=Trichoderma longibrachiatum ATCC 18648 TaxID=983965 RepID=A0A2T4C4J4_TRILO|nr:hypothetical protein M440DRAFT_321619 [Trichoderma longibrachiatum ATCC 18648]
MAESSNGQARPAEDSVCYNCGNRGHWIVACPEPIRQTPAGLANAWRNAPAAGHAGQGNNRHHANQKRPNRGPIITKYAPPPPPPPPPPPQPSLGHGTASYPPLAGPPYQQPGPQFQNPYAHYQPAPHYPTGYGPPQYPAAQYSQAPYGSAPAAPVGYTAHPQGPKAPGAPPAAASASYPPPYPSYPPPGPSSTPAYPPPAAYAPPYPQQPYAPAPVPYPVHAGPAHYPPPPSKPPHAAKTQHPQAASRQGHHPQAAPRRSHRPQAGPSQPHHPQAAPSLPILHSLPPKPPQSIHAQQDTHHDNRNKRKHDRHAKHRDRRRDQGSRHRSSNQKTQNKANRSNRSNRSNASGSAAAASQKRSAPVNAEGIKGGTLLSTGDLEHDARRDSKTSESSFQQAFAESNDAQESRQQDAQSNDGDPDDESHTADESSHSLSSDEPEKQSQGGETPSLRDDEHHVHQPQDHGEDAASTPGSITPAASQLNGKHKRRDDESEDGRQLKRTKSTASFENGLGAANGIETQSATKLEARGDEEPAVQEDDVALPPLDRPSRSRSKERHQRPKSRNSSVSSRSSDLNSLEAELLGRPARQRSPPAGNGVHQRQDRFALPKAQRRRQRNVDSAYSRRW